jgi:hypothetical protein
MDDVELNECASCKAMVPLDELHHHGDDFDLCASCAARWLAYVEACHHVWGQEPAFDDYGDEGRCCDRCRVFIDRDAAVSWFPFICDGYVELADRDA